MNKQRKLERCLKHIGGHYTNERGDKYSNKNFHFQESHESFHPTESFMSHITIRIVSWVTSRYEESHELRHHTKSLVNYVTTRRVMNYVNTRRISWVISPHKASQELVHIYVSEHYYGTNEKQNKTRKYRRIECICRI